MQGVSPSRPMIRKNDAGHRSGARRPRKPEQRLFPISLGLWVLALVSFVLAFVLGNTGSGAVMSLSFIGGLLLSTLADVGAFLTALASSVTYRKHRPWNIVLLLATVLISPATLLVVLQAALTM